jgi:hypothetical protein
MTAPAICAARPEDAPAVSCLLGELGHSASPFDVRARQGLRFEKTIP